MAGPPPLEVNPPLINSACPWATTLDDLRLLYACPSTGAVTTRTSMINGFNHDPAKHQYAFFDAAQAGLSPTASLNSLGYSPLTLETYLGFIKTISDELPPDRRRDIATSYTLIASAAPHLQFPLAMEINLSCPNIPNRPPPAYSKEALTTYLTHLQQAIAKTRNSSNPIPRIPVGLKTPPYTHTTQFLALISALERAADTNDNDDDDNDDTNTCPISFITATNTLGSCLLFSSPPDHDNDHIPSSLSPALPGTGIGGIAGAPLHPLALGNVATIRRLLDGRGSGVPAAEGQEKEEEGRRSRRRLGHVKIVGMGGVLDGAGYRRMRAAGADVVGVATGLGLRGVGVFGEIERGLEGRRW